LHGGNCEVVSFEVLDHVAAIKLRCLLLIHVAGKGLATTSTPMTRQNRKRIEERYIILPIEDDNYKSAPNTGFELEQFNIENRPSV
jgi:hypothetical protein